MRSLSQTPSSKAPLDSTADAFIAEVRKVRGRKNPLSLAALRVAFVKSTSGPFCPPRYSSPREALSLEQKISDLVNQVYGLTPESEVRPKTRPLGLLNKCCN